MTSPRVVAGSLLMAVPLVFMAGFTGLQLTFGYPDILRHPAGQVLTRFAAGGADLHLYWYAMFFGAVVFNAAAIATGLLFWKRDPLLAGLSIGFGTLAGLVQALGLLRWVILVPVLATHYLAPGASEIDRAATVAIFDFANQYLGAGVGEHMGYMLTAVWTAMLSVLMFRDRRIVASFGLAIAAGVAFGILEAFGVGMAAVVVSISYSLWAVWTLIVGVTILRGKSEVAIGMPQAA